MDSRGALISDRPSLSSGSGPGVSFPSSRPIQTSSSGLSFGVSSGGGLDVPSLASAASIGNYKGVMLCNRPAPLDAGGKGASATGFGTGSDGLTPFTVSGSHETVHPFGQHRELQERWHAAQELKKQRPPNPLVAMIRADINRIAQKKADLQRQKADEEARREKRKVELMESQRLLRELIRSQPMPEDEEGYREEEHKEEHKKKPSMSAYASISASASSNAKHTNGGGGAGSKPNQGKSAPAWARTERAINDSEDEEADNLLSFASNLDYDEYEGDLEGKAGETLIAKNLRAVEAEESAELAKLAAIEAAEAKEEEKERRKERAIRRRRRARRERRRARAAASAGHEEKKGDGEGISNSGFGDLDVDSGIEDEDENGDDDDDDDPYGDANGDDVYNDHDNDSLAVHDDTEEDTAPSFRPKRPDLDAESVAESMAAQGIRNVHSKKSLKTVINKVTADVISAGPKIVVHNEFKPAMEAAKGLVQNLPYANRNPAV